MGRCPHCGAEIEVSDGAPRPAGGVAEDVATRLSVAADIDTIADALDAAGTPLNCARTIPAESPTASIPVDASTVPNEPRSRRAPSPRMLALIGALAIALVGVSAYVLASHGAVLITLTPFTSSGVRASSTSTGGGSAAAGGASGSTTVQGKSSQSVESGATVAPTTSPPSVGTGTVVPSPSGTPTVSATVIAVGTGTAVPAQSVLSVSPTTIRLSPCPGFTTPAQFTVANTGGQPLSWGATSQPSANMLSPLGGMLDAGQSVTVTISGFSSSGTVTGSAPGAQNSPHIVSIQCQR